jgi:hypothetical protein
VKVSDIRSPPGRHFCDRIFVGHGTDVMAWPRAEAVSQRIFPAERAAREEAPSPLRFPHIEVDRGSFPPRAWFGTFGRNPRLEQPMPALEPHISLPAGTDRRRPCP